MIVGAAVCPGAPFLVDGVADALARRVSDVGQACRQALALLPPADAVVLVSAGRTVAGPGWRVLPVGSVISGTSIVRSDRTADELMPGPTAPVITDPAVGTIVGIHLLVQAATTPPTAGGCGFGPVVTVEVSGDPAGAAVAAGAAIAGLDRVVLLVVADGAGCHGDDAPGRRDDRSAEFDAALVAALAAGDPGRLAAACENRALAAELLAIVDPLAVLAELTRDAPPEDAEVLYSGAPLGVGYLVASWRWRDR